MTNACITKLRMGKVYETWTKAYSYGFKYHISITFEETVVCGRWIFRTTVKLLPGLPALPVEVSV